MNYRDLLLHQTEHVYRWLTQATAYVDWTAAQMLLGARRERPAIAWLVGHLLLEAESTAEAVAGLARTLDERERTPLFECASAHDWQTLRTLWIERSAACIDALKCVSPADLDTAPLVPILPEFQNTLTDRRRFWSGHVFHMSYHLGQLGNLRAELELGWWSA